MASASLSRSISSSPTNPDKFTVSMWIKRTGQGTEQVLLGNYSSSNFRGKLQFKSNDKLEYYQVNDGNATAQIRTTRVFRDSSAWYHLVVQFDTSQGTASDRIKIYINGTQETDFDLTSYPAQNLDMRPNQASTTLHIGQDGNSGNYLDGELAHVHLADGQTYAPTVFAETDATTGIWKAKTAPTVTYGDDGFFLKFDNSANMGLDSSGNSNNFTTNGTIIQTKDTPSNVFCTMNPVDFGDGSSNATLSLINTKAISGGSNWRHSHGVLGFTAGKYYFEGKQGLTSDGDTGYVIGFCDQRYKTTDDPNSGTPNAKFYGRQGTTFYTPSGKTDNYFPASSAGDILMVALDLDNNKIWFGLNGTWHNTNGSAGNTSYSSTTLNSSYPDATSVTIDTSNAGVYMPMIGSYNDGYIEANFGNGYFGTSAVSSAQNPDDGIGIFEYSPPTGFRALCTKSINAQEYS